MDNYNYQQNQAPVVNHNNEPYVHRATYNHSVSQYQCSQSDHIQNSHYHYDEQQATDALVGSDTAPTLYYSVNNNNSSCGLYCNYLGQPGDASPTYSYRSPCQVPVINQPGPAIYMNQNEQQQHYQHPINVSSSLDYNSSHLMTHNNSIYYTQHQNQNCKSSPAVIIYQHHASDGMNNQNNVQSSNVNYNNNNSNYDVANSPNNLMDCRGPIANEEEQYHQRQGLSFDSNSSNQPIGHQIELIRTSSNSVRETYNAGSLYMDYVGYQRHHPAVPSVSLCVSSSNHLNHLHPEDVEHNPIENNHHYQDYYTTNHKLNQQENDFFTSANEMILTNNVGSHNDRLVTLRLEHRTMSISATSEEISEHLLTTQNLNRGPSSSIWSEMRRNGTIASNLASSNNDNVNNVDQEKALCSSSSVSSRSCSGSQNFSNGSTTLTKTTTLIDFPVEREKIGGVNDINNPKENASSSDKTTAEQHLKIKPYRDKTYHHQQHQHHQHHNQHHRRGETKKAIMGIAYNHLQTSSNLKSNQCDICGRDYARPSTLKTHLRTHTNERPFRCQTCHKTFSQAANLTAHHRIHTGERPFSCPICSRKFSQSSSVITHLRTHSGERPYRCTSCSKTFSDSSTLTKHCRIHSGEKPYQCAYCPLNFSQSGNLSRHLKLHVHNNEHSNNSKNSPNGNTDTYTYTNSDK